MTVIKAKSVRGDYAVTVGCGIDDRLCRTVESHRRGGRLFVFYDAGFYALHGDRVNRVLRAKRRLVEELVLPSGERTKSARELAALYDFLLDKKVSRSDLILACGGGVTLDLTGYASATTMRGIRWGAVPTTLIGMADAAIGGKTGINHALGKNLIGTFWPPCFVHCDVGSLATLDRRQMTAGFGELLKTAGLAGGEFLERLKNYPLSHDLYDNRRLVALVARAVRYKVARVARDERDRDARMVLNYGHTFAHGLEKADGYRRLLHGEAVILGIHAALDLGARLGCHSRGLEDYRDLAERFIRMLPRRRIDSTRVLEAMELDKKRDTGGARFVLLQRPGKPVIRGGISRRNVKAALEDTLDYYHMRGRDA